MHYIHIHVNDEHSYLNATVYAHMYVYQNSRFQHQDVVEGMTAFFEKRQPNYKNTLDE